MQLPRAGGCKMYTFAAVLLDLGVTLPWPHPWPHLSPSLHVPPCACSRAFSARPQFTGVERALEYTRLPGEEDSSRSSDKPQRVSRNSRGNPDKSSNSSNDSSSRISLWASGALRHIMIRLGLWKGGSSCGSNRSSSKSSRERRGWGGSWGGRGRGRGGVDYGSEEERRHIWPSQGCLRVERLTVCYRRSSPPVLNGVSFDLQGGEKCGIVGRTGR